MLNKLAMASVTVSAALVTIACQSPQVMTYSAGFSFSKYDFLVVGKPIPGQTTALYGMDIEVANLMARHNMKILGDKEYVDLKPEDKLKTLFVRFSLTTFNTKKNLIAVSFDDAITNKTVANLTAQAKGDMYDPKVRLEALETVSQPLSQALKREKGLTVSVTQP